MNRPPFLPSLRVGQALAGIVASTVIASFVLAAGFIVVGTAPAMALSFAAVGAVGAGFVASRVLSTAVLSQTQGLASAITLFSRGDMNARAPRANLGDVADLTDAFNDMAERVAQATRRLAHEAFHDPLTGLPNRTYFMSRFHSAIEDAAGRGGRVAVLCLDLDRFKVINDTLGHGVGDELLSVAAVRLKATVGGQHMVARLGGDEFTVLLEDAGDAQTIQMAERIVEALRRSFHVAGHELYVTASVGVALTPRRPGSSAPDLLRQADIALYSAKKDGAGRYVVFQPSLDGHSPDVLQLEAGLIHAIERGQLRVFYQPEIDLVRGELIGMEALVRWEHPVRGLVSPAAFIPLAEETGEIIRIGRWVLEEACRTTVALHRAYPEVPLQVGVNVSAKEFRLTDIVQNVADVLRSTGLPPECLELEITESAVIDNLDAAVNTLNRLRALGVSLAIDDFGTGYSSLSYLHRMPLTTLKIDRSFVKEIARGESNAAVARAIVDVAAALGMEVVAEGIETRAQLEFFRTVRCHRAQGFLFSKPLPLADFENLVASRARRKRGELAASASTVAGRQSAA